MTVKPQPKTQDEISKRHSQALARSMQVLASAQKPGDWVIKTYPTAHYWRLDADGNVVIEEAYLAKD